MKKNNNKKGFTIVELVIVIAVIAILAAVLIPTFSNVIEKSNKSATLQEARNYYTEVYANDIADGKIDGKTDGTTAVTMPNNDCTDYTHADGKVTGFKYTKRGYTATFDGSTGKWTVAPATTPAP